jgi:hypothetical protein
MKIPLLIIAGLAGIGLLVLFLRRRVAPTYHVASNEIPEVISQLQRSEKDGNFAVLMFVPAGSTDGEAVNLQYSIQHGVAGFDWVLIGPRNVADKARVSEIASTLGHHLEECEMNDIRYLRSTGRGISELGATILRDLYNIGPSTKLDMITEGFEWQPDAR